MKNLFNFDNIGKKIKNLAKYSFWITVSLIWIAAVVFFIICLSDIDDYELLILIPIIAPIVCPFLIYINSSLFMHLVNWLKMFQNSQSNKTKIQINHN